MARWRRRRWGSVAGWAVAAAAGLGTGAAVLALLEPGRRARARRALDRVGDAAREAGGRVSAFRAELPASTIQRRPGLFGALLVARAAMGGGVLRIPFGLLGLSTLARTASGSARARAALDAATRGVRRASAALRSYSRGAAERAASAGGEAGGPEASPG